MDIATKCLLGFKRYPYYIESSSQELNMAKPKTLVSELTISGLLQVRHQDHWGAYGQTPVSEGFVFYTDSVVELPAGAYMVLVTGYGRLRLNPVYSYPAPDTTLPTELRHSKYLGTKLWANQSHQWGEDHYEPAQL